MKKKVYESGFIEEPLYTSILREYYLLKNRREKKKFKILFTVHAKHSCYYIGTAEYT